MKLIYPAYFSAFDEGKGYTVEFPDLPGCITQGDNLAEAFEMAEDAAAGWILTSIEDCEELPKPSKNLQNDEYTFVNFILIDIDEYAKKYSTKSVKKTLTIPQWLNTLAEKENVNFSQILQKAIVDVLQIDYSNETNSNDRNHEEHEEIISKLDGLSDCFASLNNNFAVSNTLQSMIALNRSVNND